MRLEGPPGSRSCLNTCSSLSSVLESDPEFGFEEAKRQLEGTRLLLPHPLKSVSTSSVFSNDLDITLAMSAGIIQVFERPVLNLPLTLVFLRAALAGGHV